MENPPFCLFLLFFLLLLRASANPFKDDMTVAQSTRVTNENLAKIGTYVGLGAHIQLNPFLRGIAPNDLMATTVKAIVGAVYLDTNRDISVIHRFVLRASSLVNTAI